MYVHVWMMRCWAHPAALCEMHVCGCMRVVCRVSCLIISSSRSDRYPAASTQAADLSRTGTTNELFLGSAKGSIRIPNYSGHVPASHVNMQQLRGTANVNGDAIILTSYRHDMPGYGGHAIGTTHGIQNVSNDRGPRTPRGKRQVDQGLQASVILESMKI